MFNCCVSFTSLFLFSHLSVWYKNIRVQITLSPIWLFILSYTHYTAINLYDFLLSVCGHWLLETLQKTQTSSSTRTGPDHLLSSAASKDCLTTLQMASTYTYMSLQNVNVLVLFFFQFPHCFCLAQRVTTYPSIGSIY